MQQPTVLFFRSQRSTAAAAAAAATVEKYSENNTISHTFIAVNRMLRALQQKCIK